MDISQQPQQTTVTVTQHPHSRKVAAVNEWNSPSPEADEFIRHSWAYSLELIRVNENGLSFYSNLKASTIERWLKDDRFDLHRCLVKTKGHETFKKQLDEHCSMLASAAALAKIYLDGYHWSMHWHLNQPFALGREGCELSGPDPRDVDTEPHFPGVKKLLLESEIGRVDELPTAVALLVDRALRLNHGCRHNNRVIALHSRIAERDLRWCDMENVKQAPIGTSFILNRKYFSSELYELTAEPYVLVMRAPSGVSPDTLVHSRLASRYVETSFAIKEHCQALLETRVVIPTLPNAQILRAFRRFLPIAFLVEDEVLLVEYDWNTAAFDKQLTATGPEEGAHADEDTLKGTGDVASHYDASSLIVAAIRPMPFVPEAPSANGFDFDQPVWDDLIPF